MILISAAIGVVILVFTTREHTQTLEQSLIRENELLTKTIVRSIETGYVQGFFPFKTLKEISDSENILFLWIAKPNGEIYFADDPALWGKIINDPFLGKEESMVRDSIDAKNGKKIKLISQPIKRGIGEKPWTLFLGVSLEPIKIAQRYTIFLSLGIFLLAISLAGLISFYFSKRITAPLEKLRKGAEIIGKGNLDYQIKIKTGDEIEELALAFSQMTKDLKRSREELEEYSKTLEIKVDARTRELKELAESLDVQVKEKTKELQQRIEELERFRKLTVGRELKMIELKKEIKKIKKGENKKL